MYVRVKYRKDELNGYGGREYTFLCDIPVQPYQKVLVDSTSGEWKQAIITEINVPESELDPAWINRIKKVKGYDA